MTGSVPFRLLVLLAFRLTSPCAVDAYTSDFLEDGDGREHPFARLEEKDIAPRQEEALQKIQEILGIRSQGENLTRRKIPPQFMVELYNTIADPSGITRGHNPYNAKVVRSFVERDTTLSNYYFFNISGLEMDESVLEAELHLYRKKTPPRNVHPLTLTSPYYMIRVYQVLDDRDLDAPDLHRLLSVRYVGAHASGWQVFNVKRAVLEWTSGKPNLGLLVTASTLFEDEAPAVEFSRRNDYHHGRQPILVLFDDDNADRSRTTSSVAPRYYAYRNQDRQEEEDEDEKMSEKNEEEEEEEKRLAYRRDAKGERIDPGNAGHESAERFRERDGQPEEVQPQNRREPELFQRQKRRRGEETDEARVDRRRRRRDAAAYGTRSARIPTSTDVYARATFRDRSGRTARRRRSASASATAAASATGTNGTSECARRELDVNFHEIGLSSSIIAPAGYSAYQCKGVCVPPLSQDQRPTNHAMIQAIVHKMGLVEGVERPCCVPTKLLGTSILFYDDNENVVLKMYEDMIVEHCGCR